jgi:shikimate kinase
MRPDGFVQTPPLPGAEKPAPETGGRNIILTGYRGTGKTQAGLALAALLGYSFLDTDELVRRRTGQTVERIVAAGGWEAFRAAEHAAVVEAARAKRAVIALGGGAILDPRNVAALKEKGCFVWLTADVATIVARLAKDPASASQRPSLSGRPIAAEVAEVLAEREPLYRRDAALIIDTSSRTPAEVAAAICAALNSGPAPTLPDGAPSAPAKEA